MRIAIALGVIVSLACLGCGGNPTAPTLRLQGPPVSGSGIPPGPAISSLAFSAASIELSRGGQSSFLYRPRKLALTETSGKSAATVLDIEISTPNSGIGEHDCLGIGRRIPIGPGQTLDLAPEIGYCMPYAVTSSLSSEVHVSVAFVDDERRSGVLEFSIDVSGCTLVGKPDLVALCN